MKKTLAAAALALLALAGCAQDASKADLKEPQQKGRSIPDDYEVRVPEKLTVYQNIDGHPTIAKVCVSGVAFATTSRDYTSLTRIPEWDGGCPKAGK